MTSRIRWSLLVLCLLVASCFRSASPPVSDSRPRLIVLVIFDQMRADYLTRWSEQFGDGGFRRLGRDGVTYANCNYPYANTVTGDGHATMATGCTPDQHGIIDNDWYDRATAKAVNCATSNRATDVCSVSPSTQTKADSDPSAGSPEKLLMPTFADALQNSHEQSSQSCRAIAQGPGRISYRRESAPMHAIGTTIAPGHLRRLRTTAIACTIGRRRSTHNGPRRNGTHRHGIDSVPISTM